MKTSFFAILALLASFAPVAKADQAVGVKTLMNIECTGYLDRYSEPEYKLTFSMSPTNKPTASIWVRNPRSEDLSYRRIQLGEVKVTGNDDDMYVGNARFRLWIRDYRRSDRQDNGIYRDYDRKFQTRFDCGLKDIR